MSKYFKIVTLGCKVNSYESEAIAQKLQGEGYLPFVEGVEPDIVIINTCSVTSASDSKSRQMINREHRNHPKALIGVCGCYSQIDSKTVANLEGVNVVIGTNHRSEIIDYIKDYQNEGKQIVEVEANRSMTAFEKINVTSYNDNTRAFLKIQDGCNNFCSYCIIPYARGPMRSRPKEDVLKEAKELVEAGFKEIVLTGIHTAGYGQDMKDYSFTELLKDLLKEVPSLHRIRISSIEESEISEEFIQLLASECRIVPHLHIPLQSGCDSVLKRMNRKYLCANYYETICKIRKVLPYIAITTDVIVGFPAESDEEFEQTVAFIKKVNFAALHVFPYSRRSGTVADKMSNQINGDIKKSRARILLNLGKVLGASYASKFEGKELDILFETYDEVSKLVCGHAPNYLKVYCPGDKLDLDTIKKVIITKSGYPSSLGVIKE